MQLIGFIIVLSKTKQMKKYKIVLLLASLAFCMSSSVGYARKTFTAPQEERTVANFKGIAAGGPIDVKVSIGNKEAIRFEGDQNAIAELTSEVINGILIIKPKTKWSDWSRRYSRPEITVYITAKRLSSLAMSGSGNMVVDNAISGSELVVTLSGSGSIKATANTGKFTAVISGSGTMDIKGKADDSNLTLSGSGNFLGKGFTVNDASVQISGSADVFIKANSKLEAVISGSGNITYTGNPVVKKTILGSGNISKG